MGSSLQALVNIGELRRVRNSISDPDAKRSLGAVIGRLRRDLGVGVPKRRAAALLGVSVQALERWVKNGLLPVVHVPGSSRELIDTEALLVLAEEVTRLRELGNDRGIVSTALRTLRDDGRLPRKLRPNQSARELRHEYLHTTPEDRLRTGVTLSEVGA